MSVCLSLSRDLQVGGCLLIGAVCWYNFYPTVGVRDMAADVSGALQVGAIEELVPSGDEEVNKGKGSPAPSFGEAGGVFSAAQWPPAGQRVKRYSVVSRDGNLTAAFDSSATILLPKESFGGQHFLMGAQQGPFPKPPKESSKPFSLLPGFFGGADQRPQQTKASADYNREAPSACQIPQHSDPQRQTNTITEQVGVAELKGSAKAEGAAAEALSCVCFRWGLAAMCIEGGGHSAVVVCL